MAAVGLEPVPFFTEDFGYLGAAFIPMGGDSGLNEFKIRQGDCPCSDGNGQHFHCIAERSSGRQQKMGMNRKNFHLSKFEPEFGPILGLAMEIKP